MGLTDCIYNCVTEACNVSNIKFGIYTNSKVGINKVIKLINSIFEISFNGF